MKMKQLVRNNKLKILKDERYGGVFLFLVKASFKKRLLLSCQEVLAISKVISLIYDECLKIMHKSKNIFVKLLQNLN